MRALNYLLIASVLSVGFALPALAQAPLRIGDTVLERDGDSGNGNMELAQAVILPQSATISSLSFYVTQASGKLILGLYDSTGSKGGPGKLLAVTNSFATAIGWNTAAVVTPVSLAPGNYWLAYLPSSGNLAFLKQNDSGSCFYMGAQFSQGMPATFATSTSNCSPTTWSFYATVVPTGGGVFLNGACGSSNGANLTSAPTSNLCTAGAASSVTGSGPWNWSCSGSGGGTTASCLAQRQVIGSCGSANGVAASVAPAANLCSAGTGSAVAGTGPWSWKCTGSNGGGTASCAAPLAKQAVNGTCGSANGVAASTAPASNLCSAGISSAVTGNGPWAWSCNGSNGGNTASCSAPLSQSQQSVNGSCGAANGAPVRTPPTTNLCGAGTASTVTGNGPWDWECTGANGGTAASCQAPVGGKPTPVLVQHVASSANPVGVGIPGNNYKIPLPNPVLAGDALVLAVTYPNGSTSSVSDSLGQTWPAAAITKDAGSGNYVTQIYVLCGSSGGRDTINVGLTRSGQPFQYTVSEFNNVATTACVDGAIGGSNLSPDGSGVINPGTFTPAVNNDANGGHIVWSYTAISSSANGNPSLWIPASGFTLLDGDIAWINKQGFPHASQWYLQANDAPVTPSIASRGDSADTFNSASVSLRVASAGGTMPSGIHVNKIVHETWVALSSGTTLTLQLPATGNLRVLAFAAGLNNINITSITDSDGGTWVGKQTGGDSAQIWYAGNRPPNSSLTVSIHIAGSSPTNSVRFFDIQGASASPFDVAAGTDLTACTSATINNQPTITPTGTNELVIATMGIGDGPGLGLASGAPSGAFWDLTTYSGQFDTDLMENSDALAHVYTSTTSVENWNWTITVNGNNSCSAEAVAFK